MVVNHEFQGTKVRKALRLNLMKIKAGDKPENLVHANVTTREFVNDMAQVFDPPVNPEKITGGYPACNIFFETLDILNSPEGGEHTTNLLHYRQNVELEIWFDKQPDMELAFETMTQDVINLLMNRFQLPDENDDATASELMFQEFEPVGIEDNQNLFALIVRLQIWYNTELLDPTTKR